MFVKLIEALDNWQNIKNATMTTIGKDAGAYPSPEWKRRLLMCEHSPIRKLKISAKWYNLKSWISVHFVRHKIGIEHWVKTQRSDRTGVNRDELPQGNLVEHEIEMDAQTAINISKKRLCLQASPETREAWTAMIDSFKDTQPELRVACVPECVYRNGLCPEYKSCGFNKTPAFEKMLKEYLAGFENQINPNTNIFKK